MEFFIMARDLRNLKHIGQMIERVQSILPILFIFGFIGISILSHQFVHYQKMIVITALVGSGIFTIQQFYLYLTTKIQRHLILSIYFAFFTCAFWGLKYFNHWHLIG